jgi:tRNA (cmo5U34)-methyltransferase
MKSTVEEIRQRFDNDVERFSNLETGQSAAVDAVLCLDLIAQAAARVSPGAKSVLDIGCGAGNYSLKLLQQLPDLDVTLLDLSQPMLNRASSRVQPATSGAVETVQADIREFEAGRERFDIVLAAAVFHHLREASQWQAVFSRLHRALKSGGSLWIFDHVESATPQVQGLMKKRHGEHLTQLRDEAYRDEVFAYIEKEDTPRPLLFQIDILRQAGFHELEILHVNTNFAAFGAIKR